MALCADAVFQRELERAAAQVQVGQRSGVDNLAQFVENVAWVVGACGASKSINVALGTVNAYSSQSHRLGRIGELLVKTEDRQLQNRRTTFER